MGFFNELARGIIAAQMMPVLAEFERQQHERMQELLNEPYCTTTVIDLTPPRKCHRRFHSRMRSPSKWIKTMQE